MQNWAPRVADAAGIKSGDRVLDVACGTGVLTRAAAERAAPGGDVSGLDLDPGMLAVAARINPGLRWQQGSAGALPFADDSFDAVVSQFGLMFFPEPSVALREMMRVLKRGGRFLVLEFSTVDLPGLDVLYKEWSDRAIPPIGRVVTGDAQPYQYLVESIRKFPPPGKFTAMIEKAGFKRVTHTAMTGNIAALHAAWKI